MPNLAGTRFCLHAGPVCLGCPEEIPQTAGLRPQKCAFSQCWRRGVHGQGVSRFGFCWGLSSWPVHSHPLLVVVPMRGIPGSLSVSSSLLVRTPSAWTSTHSNGLILTELSLVRSYAQTQSLGVRAPTCEFRGNVNVILLWIQPYELLTAQACSPHSWQSKHWHVQLWSCLKVKTHFSLQRQPGSNPRSNLYLQRPCSSFLPHFLAVPLLSLSSHTRATSLSHDAVSLSFPQEPCLCWVTRLDPLCSSPLLVLLSMRVSSHGMVFPDQSTWQTRWGAPGMYFHSVLRFFLCCFSQLLFAVWLGVWEPTSPSWPADSMKAGKMSHTFVLAAPTATRCRAHTKFAINICWMDEWSHGNLSITWPLAVCPSFQIIHSTHPHLIIVFPTGGFISGVTGEEERAQWVIFGAAVGEVEGGQEWAEHKVGH